MEKLQSHVFSVVDSIDNDDQPLPCMSIRKLVCPGSLEDMEQDTENNDVTGYVVNDGTENLEEMYSLDIDESFDRVNVSSLPPGWVKTNHISGFPIYTHDSTTVCSLTRPYYIGPGSTKSHPIPECAIPCLWYNTMLEKREEGSYKNGDTDEVNNSDSTSAVRQEQERISTYCKKLFRFRTIKYRIFKSWEVRRSFERASKIRKGHKRSIDRFAYIKRYADRKVGKPALKNKVKFNPVDFTGKSYVAVLHEFMQQTYKAQPVYNFKELDNAKTPYSSTAVINNSEYGIGVGISKKEAKIQAARATLEILNPDLLLQVDGLINEDEETTSEKRDYVNVFNSIPVTDHRVSLFCSETTVPTPYEILESCLRRKYNTKVDIDIEMNSDMCTVRCGDLSASVICRNKREGKQKSSQVLLQQLHPFIGNWGALLRLYGCKSSVDEKEFNRLLVENENGEVEEEDNLIHPVNAKLIAIVKKFMIRFRKRTNEEELSDVSTEVSSESEEVEEEEGEDLSGSTHDEEFLSCDSSYSED